MVYNPKAFSGERNYFNLIVKFFFIILQIEMYSFYFESIIFKLQLDVFSFKPLFINFIAFNSAFSSFIFFFFFLNLIIKTTQLLTNTRAPSIQQAKGRKNGGT